MRQNYFYVLPGGEPFPNFKEGAKFRRDNGAVEFLLDACVCIDIDDVATGLGGDELSRVNDLLVKRKNLEADFNPMLGIMESSILDKCTFTLDDVKFESTTTRFASSVNKISANLGIPLKENTVQIDSKHARKALAEMRVQMSAVYVAFLKSVVIHRSASPKATAVEKFDLLVGWMLEELKASLVFPLQTALLLFSGDPVGEKMLNYRSSSFRPIHDCWSAAFDVHNLMKTHEYKIRGARGNKSTAIYVTNDKSASSIMGLAKMEFAIVGDNQISAANQLDASRSAYNRKAMRPILRRLENRARSTEPVLSDSELLRVVDSVENEAIAIWGRA